MNILIYSKDAGGAEILSSWIKHKKIKNFHAILEGPAVKVYKSKFKKIEIKKKSINVKNYDKFLFSTSFPPSFELDLLKNFKDKNKKTIAFLDHWVNYDKRFKKNNINFLPDQIIVADGLAFKIAKKKFKQTKIIREKNYFLIEKKSKLKKIKKTKKYILILSSPKYNSLKNFSKQKSLKQNKIHMKYIIKKILQYKEKFVSNKILIRLHPSEKKVVCILFCSYYFFIIHVICDRKFI